MLASTVRFTDDAAGLEKTLRLSQGICTTVIGLTASIQIAAPWIQARNQINLGRRYLRLLKWHPCWEIAYSTMNRSDQSGLEKLLEVAKWSFLGLYYFVEMPTITNAMGVTNYTWGPVLQNEANKCWFYAISFSIMLSLHQLCQLAFATSAKDVMSKPTPTENEKETKQPATPEANMKTAHSSIYVQLAIDCCDLLIPGYAVGWIPVDQVAVGVAQSISSVLAARGIWERVQAERRR